ncbi:MAG: hypothetical protein JW863_12345 [Chitinispirillaceae bacterium]|nr:hypothetical protein [Chitinispirillaceae bacterium]
MSRFPIIFTIIGCVFVVVFANPIAINPYEMPGISKVEITNSSSLRLELDGDWCCFDRSPEEYPFTETFYIGVFLTRDQNIFPGTLNRIDVRFDTTRLAVIPIQSSQPSLLSIAIMRDTTDIDRETSWVFPLRETTPGRTLVSFSDDDSDAVFETERGCIGIRTEFMTINRLYILNSHYMPYRYLSVDLSSGSIPENWHTYEFFHSISTNNDGMVYVPVPL